MARAKTKSELISSSTKTFQKLLEQIETIPPERIAEAGACESWSVKDILAHLHAWHMLFLTWYQIGMTGEKPAMPAPGFTWKQTPQLNEEIYQEYKGENFDDILRSLKESHQEVTAIIHRHTNQELFTKKLYPWTGSTSLGSYLISNTASHYTWADDLIRRWLKQHA